MKERAHQKLNVGCGFDYRLGYVNVDMHARHNPDVVANVLDLASFPSAFYEEVIAQDVLEHVTRADVRRALFEWNRVLKPGGRIFIRTTELGGLVRLLEVPEHQNIEDQERLVQNLFGTQAYTGDFHLSGFTEGLFRFYMWEAGFEVDSLSLHHGAFLDAWATRARSLGFERLEQATDERFLREAFQEVLGRAPATGELSGELDSSAARRALVMKLLLGDERRAALRLRAPTFPRTLHPQPLIVRLARKAKRLVKSAVRRLGEAGR